MAGIDYDKLNRMRKELEEKSSGSIMYASKIKDALEIRLLPPSANMDGVPFFEVTKWNVGDKIVTSPKTFGYTCPIDEEVTVATAWVKANANSHDPATKQYAKDLSKLLNNWEACKEKSEYLVPVIILSNVGDEYTASNPKLLSCGATVVKDITAIMADRKYMNGTPDGITDRVKGRNFTITKTGEKKDTRYKATPWPSEMPMPAELYAEGKFVDPVEFVKKGLKSEAYLRSLIRNYLYGEEVLEEESFFEDGEAPENVGEIAQEPKQVISDTTPEALKVKTQGLGAKITSNVEFDSQPANTPTNIKVGVADVSAQQNQQEVSVPGPKNNPKKVGAITPGPKNNPATPSGVRRSIGKQIKDMGTKDPQA